MGDRNSSSSVGEQVPGFGVANVSSGTKALSSGSGKKSGTGMIFFKTKLCSRFRAGNCPYPTNCNFAHGMEELRKPPPGWEEFVNPPLSSSSVNHQDVFKDAPAAGTNSQKLRHCKNFFTEGVCPYGERCIFSHEDPAAVFSAPPTIKPASSSVVVPPSVSSCTGKPGNWKTRLCNKWETTGYCPFAEKCHFAHGGAELQKFAAGSMDSPSTTTAFNVQTEIKASQASSPATPFMAAAAPPPQQSSNKPAQAGSISSSNNTAVWRGPTEGISTVYGDWLEKDDSEEDDEEDEDRDELPPDFGMAAGVF